MRKFIKQRLREEMIDGQNMNSGIKKFCNDMSIPKNWINKDYDETVEFLIKYIGPKDGQNAAIWEKIQPQLDQWKQQEDSINQQIKNEKMSGDSNPDNNTYWANIQSTICEQGPDFE